MTKIAIIGPGAIGGTTAAWLAQNPANEITVCARTPVAQLRVETPDGTLSVIPRMLTDASEGSAVDWIVVATKAYDAEGAARWFPRLLGGATRVAILQNGVEHVARFAPYAPRDRILPVVVECPAERLAPGQIRQRGSAWMVVPESDDGRDFAALFAGTKVEVRITSDWLTAAWRKLCLNAPGAVSAITLKPAGVARIECVADVMRGIIREVVRVGRAEGAQLDESLVESVVSNCRKAPPDGINSLHADRLAGRPMEIDARNGVVVRLGRKHGIATPFNEMAVALLRAVQAGVSA